ncbi:hypothetical protein AVEN_184963-1 [Araneus ventricosus]|uniref:Uncharacterized protein n=1 Tax=Araneus ventricosus TaxID=182803 RepID=A0A4Y2VCR8_ARAVE|nr:hypothetical protein AVEN_223622-1 [Araneus ventricosus]GBO21896.1 hypothetical protein AVEN_184963-1 [Araneus ventricosus]
MGNHRISKKESLFPSGYSDRVGLSYSTPLMESTICEMRLSEAVLPIILSFRISIERLSFNWSVYRVQLYGVDEDDDRCISWGAFLRFKSVLIILFAVDAEHLNDFATNF